MNQSAGIDLLLVEDNEDDARFVQRRLVEHGSSIDEEGAENQLVIDTIEHVDRLADGLEQVDNDPPDIVLLDLGLRDSSGLETIEKMTERTRTIPVVVLTGQTGVGVEAIRSGAQDYLVKGSITTELLLRTIRYAIERARITGELHDRTHRLALVNELVRTGIHDDVSMIVGWGDQLDGSVDPTDQQAVEGILEASNHALELVDTAAELMDVLSGDLYVNDDPYDLRAILNEEFDQFRREQDVEIDVNWCVPADEQLLVTGTPMLGSVFEHLLSNAVVHTDREEVNITVTVEADTELASVSIADNGVGISDTEKVILNSSDARQNDKSVMGTGLYLVRSTLDKIGGRIEFADNQPQGTVVTVTLDRQ